MQSPGTAVSSPGVTTRPAAGVGYIYRVSGWIVRSSRRLPYLLACEDAAAAPDVTVEFDALEPIGQPRHVIGPCHIFAPSLVELRLRGRLNIRIADGRSLTVDAPDSCSDAELHTYLFGPAFAILAQQRGHSALHASAIAIDGAAIAIAGHSGAGKSTTARALVQRGYRFLTDDQLIVESATGLAHAGYPSTKLWGEAAALLGQQLGDASRVRPGVDKFHLRAPDEFAAESLPLRAIFVLVRDGRLAHPAATLLPNANAVATLARFVHCLKVAMALGAGPRIFRWAADLAGRVPVHLVQRPDDPAKVDALVDLLIALSTTRPRPPV